MDTFDYKKYLAEGGVQGHLQGINEWVGPELEARNQKYYDKLVPRSGPADTVEGEILRAINKIVHRWYNDGDKFYEGYGTETAGPPHSYLVNSHNAISADLNSIFNSVVDSYKDSEYESALKQALELVLDYLDKHEEEGRSEPNKEDMLNYEPEYQNHDNDEEEDDYWGEEDNEEDW